MIELWPPLLAQLSVGFLTGILPSRKFRAFTGL